MIVHSISYHDLEALIAAMMPSTPVIPKPSPHLNKMRKYLFASVHQSFVLGHSRSNVSF